MYTPKSRVPYNFNQQQLNVLKLYYNKRPYLTQKTLNEIYILFGCKIAMYHIRYWFINRRNGIWFRSILPRGNQFPGPLETPKNEKMKLSFILN